MTQSESIQPLKEGIDKRENGTRLSKHNQGAEQQHHEYDGQQPVSFSDFHKLPEFYNK
jgi:hypothetical protein